LIRNLAPQGAIRDEPIRSTISDNPVNRQFSAPHPNAPWVSDFTQVSTWAGFVHVAFVIDILKTCTDAATLVRHALNGPTMGTRYAAVFFAPEAMATDALAAALFEAVDRVDRQMSTWKPGSDLNRLNAAPVGDWIDIPHELMTVLAEAMRIGRATSGAFDIGMGALVAAWGFGPGDRQPARASSRPHPHRRTQPRRKLCIWMSVRAVRGSRRRCRWTCQASPRALAWMKWRGPWTLSAFPPGWSVLTARCARGA
jgi:hypothetical protein